MCSLITFTVKQGEMEQCLLIIFYFFVKLNLNLFLLKIFPLIKTPKDHFNFITNLALKILDSEN